MEAPCSVSVIFFCFWFVVCGGIDHWRCSLLLLPNGSLLHAITVATDVPKRHMRIHAHACNLYNLQSRNELCLQLVQTTILCSWYTGYRRYPSRGRYNSWIQERCQANLKGRGLITLAQKKISSPNPTQSLSHPPTPTIPVYHYIRSPCVSGVQ